MVRLLARVIGIGIETADMLVREILSRKLRERRAVAYAKLVEVEAEPRTHDDYEVETAFDSIVAQDHIRSEFFSKLLEKGLAFTPHAFTADHFGTRVSRTPAASNR